MMNPLLDIPFISNTRKNHALEHATIHLITRKLPGKAFAGHSNPAGFILIGDANTEMVVDTATEALNHLKQGHSSLAIHEGCGTNYVVIGGLASILSLWVMGDSKTNSERWSRFPLLFAISIIAFLVGRSVGPSLQKHVTTDANLTGMEITSVSKIAGKVHWIQTRG